MPETFQTQRGAKAGPHGVRLVAAVRLRTPRRRGIPVYGIRPYRASATDLENMHGIDERVSVTGLNRGTDMVERILRAVATR